MLTLKIWNAFVIWGSFNTSDNFVNFVFNNFSFSKVIISKFLKHEVNLKDKNRKVYKMPFQDMSSYIDFSYKQKLWQK